MGLTGNEKELAIEGGSAVTTLKQEPWPFFEQDEIDAATQPLVTGRVNYWTGTECRQFEKEFAQATGSKHAIALANGTLALELALYAYGIGPGDEVIVTPRSFIASASCIVARGATPVFADVDPVSQNITARTIEAALTPRTKAVIAVHLGGWACDMDPIMALADKRKLVVIEDCAQALGGTYKGRPIGSLGHAAAFSFCQDKILTTGGEGGMFTTNDERIWRKSWSYKDHGKDYDLASNPPPAGHTGFRWLHASFGTNWRMTEMQGAIGRVALRKVAGWVTRRNENFRFVDEAISHFECVRRTPVPREIGHAAYRYYAFVRPEKLKAGWNRDRIVAAIAAEGVPCFSGSCGEMYLEKAFDAAFRPEKRFPAAQELGETSIAFLVHPTLTAESLRNLEAAIKKVLTQAQKS